MICAGGCREFSRIKDAGRRGIVRSPTPRVTVAD